MNIRSDEMTKQPKKVSRADETELDLIQALDIIDQLNTRVFALEKKIEEQVKLENLTTNTVNYILASIYVYESYFVEMGLDREMLKREIEQVYYDAFNKQSKKGVDYSDSIVKKVNDRLREFQEKVNQK